LIVHLSSHSVTIIIMVWRVCIRRVATLGEAVERSNAMVDAPQ
jgi:hypothetical protein